jgi:hypothetical protein
MQKAKVLHRVPVRDSKGQIKEVEEWMTPSDIDPNHPQYLLLSMLYSFSYVLGTEPVEKTGDRQFTVMSTGELLEVVSS